MAAYIVNHKVSDFDAWKKVYDDFQSTAIAAGITDHYVLQSVDDPNHVVVMGEGDAGDLQRFLSSDALKAAMGEAGVASKPDIYIGENRK